MAPSNLIALLLTSVVCVSSASAVTIETVPIRNPGNLADTQVMFPDGTSGYGSVPYSFRMGTYEVTAGQYTEFLNAVADTDAYGLYTEFMGDPVGNRGANIQRSGAPGSHTYSVAPDWANRPVNMSVCGTPCGLLTGFTMGNR